MDACTPSPRRRLLQGLAAGAWAGVWAGVSVGAWPRWAQAAPGELGRRPLVFPRDHGSHPDTQTEWWYLTGWLQAPQGALWGFQVTFFRSRVASTQALRSRLAARQLLFAHAAVTDVAAGRLHHHQMTARWDGRDPPPGAEPVTAVARTGDTDVRIRDAVLQRGPDGSYQARVAAGDWTLDLQATPTQPLLLQGEAGWSRKGPEPHQASFYYSQPQLRMTGRLLLAGRTAEVTGRGWLDHEWSEALLHPDAVGWDWMGMNLDDGGSLTAFRLRREDGRALWAGGSVRTGPAAQPPLATRAFAPGEVTFEPLRHWTSPRTAVRYPVQWRVHTPVGVFEVHALADDQELDSRASTGALYWEGLSELRTLDGRRAGRGYLELTGYGGALRL
ncbi:lipocalin-like domain-containing protein [Tepidimonas sp.]|uniref:lipocalin-like domain-containing protein n=1 Tax=Tepidimonas sp. TaxID=2002775 RepID=UPI00391C118C